MAGGQGTRLRPFTNVLPKPLVPIGDMSILELVLHQLSSHGFSEVILSVGYKAELIMAVIGDGSRFGLCIEYVHEPEMLGTVGSLRLIPAPADDFLIVNGDVCTDLNFSDVLRAHRSNNALITIASFARHEKIELGVLTVEDEQIVGFKEKPEFDLVVSMGVYAISRRVVDFVPRQGPFGFDELVLALLDAGAPIANYRFCGSWCDIGRPDDYQWFLHEFESNRGRYLPNA